MTNLEAMKLEIADLVRKAISEMNEEELQRYINELPEKFLQPEELPGCGEHIFDCSRCEAVYGNCEVAEPGEEDTVYLVDPQDDYKKEKAIRRMQAQHGPDVKIIFMAREEMDKRVQYPCMERFHRYALQEAV